MLIIEFDKDKEKALLLDGEKEFDYSDDIFIDFGIDLHYLDEENVDLDKDLYPQRQLLGRIDGIFFDVTYALNRNEDLALMLYNANHIASKLSKYILDEDNNLKKEYFTRYNNIYYIDEIFIEEKFRGKGYAKKVLSNLKDILMYTAKVNIGFIVTSSHLDIKEDEEKFVKLLENTGFKQIDNSEFYINVNE